LTIALMMLVKIFIDVYIMYQLFIASVIHAWLKEENSYQRSW